MALPNKSLNEVNVVASATETINVPSDESTLQDAVDAASERYRRRGTRINVNVDTGHSPASGISVSDGYYGHIYITSDDATVTVDTSWPSGEQFMYGEDAWMPTLDCLIDMNSENSTADNAVEAGHNCMIEVTSGNGCINSGGHGIVVRATDAWLAGSNFSGATNDGIEAQQLSRVQCTDADVNGAGRDGLFASRGAWLHAETATGGDASGCGRFGVRAARAFINASNWNLSGCQRGVQSERNAIVQARGADCTQATDRAMNASSGGKIDAQGADLSNSDGEAIRAGPSGWVHADSATIGHSDGSGWTTNIVVCADGSFVNVQDATFTELNSNNAIAMVRGMACIAHGATTGGTAIAAGDTNQGSFNSLGSDGFILA